MSVNRHHKIQLKVFNETQKVRFLDNASIHEH